MACHSQERIDSIRYSDDSWQRSEASGSASDRTAAAAGAKSTQPAIGVWSRWWRSSRGEQVHQGAQCTAVEMDPQRDRRGAEGSGRSHSGGTGGSIKAEQQEKEKKGRKSSTMTQGLCTAIHSSSQL